jgi:hypothetical protein
MLGFMQRDGISQFSFWNEHFNRKDDLTPQEGDGGKDPPVFLLLISLLMYRNFS